MTKYKKEIEEKLEKIAKDEKVYNLDITEVRPDFYNGTIRLKGEYQSQFDSKTVSADNKKEAYNKLKEKFEKDYGIELRKNPFVRVDDGERIEPRKVDPEDQWAYADEHE